MNRVPAAFVLAIVALVAAPVAADELGRLFFTPEQRSLLDLARRTQTAAPSAGEDGAVTLSGIVVRSDGRQTVWINGRAQSAAVASLRAPAAAVIPLPGAGGGVRLRVGQTGSDADRRRPHRGVRLRVGQTLDPLTGRVEEAWRRPVKTPREMPPAAQGSAGSRSRTGEAAPDETSPASEAWP